MPQPCSLHVMHIVSGDLWAGAEVQLHTLASTLQHKLGATVSVVILNHGKLEQALRETGIQVIVLDESILNGFQIFYQLIKIIREVKPDVLHTHRNKENILGSFAARLSSNIPSLRTQHGAPEHHPAWYLIHKQIICLLDWFSGQFLQARIIAVSEDLASLLKQIFPADKIRFIENGIDVESLSQLAARGHRTTDKNRESWKIGIAGRLVPVKRMDLFIETAHILLKEHPELNMTFHIFGDGPLREELQALSQRLNVAEHLTLEGHCTDMTRRLSSLDLLVMTSDHEGLPMILLEAMALQIPIVAHRVGGITKLLDHGNAGVLVDEHRPDGYVKGILHLIQNPAGRDGMVNSAFERVQTAYASDKNAVAYCLQYLQISSTSE